MLLPVVAWAYDAQMGGIYCIFDKTKKTATVTYYSSGNNYEDNKNAYSGNVIIPATVNYNGETYDVIGIGNDAFHYCSGLTSVTIPNSVTSIGGSAFAACSGLTSITIPNSVTSIGKFAFYGSGLTSITIPNSVNYIYENPFGNCKSLISIKVKAGNAIYDSRDNCNALIHTQTNSLISGCMNTIIPNNVKSIENEAFHGCSSLNSIAIPNSVTWIGNSAFEYCSGLTSITIPDGVTSIGNYAFEYCSSLTSVTIGYSVTSIGHSAFYGCKGLTSVMMVSSATNIGGTAFANCEKLKDLYCLAKDVPNERDSYGTLLYGYFSFIFSDSNIEYATLYVPKASIDAYKAREPWKSFKNIVGLTDEEIQEIIDSYETSGSPKCATPTIISYGKKIKFECETPGAEFTSYLSTTEELTGEEVSLENKDRMYTLTVYATAPGYARSKPATMKFMVKKTDVNGDGSVDVADIATVIDEMAGK